MNEELRDQLDQVVAKLQDGEAGEIDSNFVEEITIF